jgi:hypothetical protein
LYVLQRGTNEEDLRRAFLGLNNWLGRVEELLDDHHSGGCITPGMVAGVAAPGETLATTLRRTMEQVQGMRSLAASDPGSMPTRPSRLWPESSRPATGGHGCA